MAGEPPVFLFSLDEFRERGIEFASDEPTPEEIYIKRELQEAVRCAVLKLPARQCEAVRLCFWGGMTHAEAAIEMGVSVGTVKKAIHRAYGNLRKDMELVGIGA